MDHEEKLINLIWSTGMLEMEDAQYVAEYLISNGVTMKDLKGPLTLEEAKMLPVGTLIYSEHNKYPIDSCASVYYGNPGDGYGKLYRFWTGRKPTEEERKAAEWE